MVIQFSTTIYNQKLAKSSNSILELIFYRLQHIFCKLRHRLYILLNGLHVCYILLHRLRSILHTKHKAHLQTGNPLHIMRHKVRRCLHNPDIVLHNPYALLFLSKWQSIFRKLQDRQDKHQYNFDNFSFLLF